LPVICTNTDFHYITKFRAVTLPVFINIHRYCRYICN